MLMVAGLMGRGAIMIDVMVGITVMAEAMRLHTVFQQQPSAFTARPRDLPSSR